MQPGVGPLIRDFFPGNPLKIMSSCYITLSHNRDVEAIFDRTVILLVSTSSFLLSTYLVAFSKILLLWMVS